MELQKYLNILKPALPSQLPTSVSLTAKQTVKKPVGPEGVPGNTFLGIASSKLVFDELRRTPTEWERTEAEPQEPKIQMCENFAGEATATDSDSVCL